MPKVHHETRKLTVKLDYDVSVNVNQNARHGRGRGHFDDRDLDRKVAEAVRRELQRTRRV